MPTELLERAPLIVHERTRRFALSRLEYNDVNTFLAQLIGERPAARSRANNDDYRVIVVIVFR